MLHEMEYGCYSSDHTAFLVFDWMIGFPRELRLFWRDASIGATSLYAATRYLTLVTNLLYTMELSEFSVVVRQCSIYPPQIESDG